MDINDTTKGTEKNAAAESAARDILQYGDMEIEARAEDGSPIFTATLKQGVDGAFLFENVTTDTPPAGSRIAANIRGFSPAKKKTVYMRGTLVKTGDVWSSPDLSLIKAAGDRVFFRMELNTPGTLKNDAGGAACPCRVRDISNGGVRITSWGKHAEGDMLVLNADIYGIQTDVKCRVIRATGEGPYTYNCSFADMSAEVKKKLTRDILNAQFNKK